MRLFSEEGAADLAGARAEAASVEVAVVFADADF